MIKYSLALYNNHPVSERKVNKKMQDRIIAYCTNSIYASHCKNYFLLDFSEVDRESAIKLCLLENLIEQYFKITYRRSYCFIRELRYQENYNGGIEKCRQWNFYH